MQESIRVDFANTLRGFAALAVLISHHYGVFWLSRDAVGVLTNAPVLPVEIYATPHWISWLNVSSIPLFKWGPFGVALFFIISGFVIPFSLRKLSWLGFSASRFFRVVPTYVVGFSVTLLAVFFSTKYFGKEWPYSLKEVVIHYIPGIRDILQSRGIDGIVWTLEIEMKFYLLCALLIYWFRRYSLWVFLAPIFLFLTSIYLSHPFPKWVNSYVGAHALVYIMVSQYIIFMFIGVMFHYIYMRKIGLYKGYACIGGLFSFFCIAWWVGPYSTSFAVAWSYAFALLMFAFAYTFPSLFKGNRVSNFLADISYSLYVIHGVAGYVALRIMLDRGFKPWVALLTVGSVCFLLSWLIHIAVERPSRNLGKQIGTKLTKAPVPYFLTKWWRYFIPIRNDLGIQE